MVRPGGYMEGPLVEGAPEATSGGWEGARVGETADVEESSVGISLEGIRRLSLSPTLPTAPAPPSSTRSVSPISRRCFRYRRRSLTSAEQGADAVENRLGGVLFRHDRQRLDAIFRHDRDAIGGGLGTRALLGGAVGDHEVKLLGLELGLR